MPLDVTTLFTAMFTAIKVPLKAGFNIAEPFVKTQLTNIAQQIVDIEAQLATGSITKDTSSLLFDMQKNASRSVLLTVEGIGLITAENALNAALGAIAAPVNAALGFTLL